MKNQDWDWGFKKFHQKIFLSLWVQHRFAMLFFLQKFFSFFIIDWGKRGGIFRILETSYNSRRWRTKTRSWTWTWNDHSFRKRKIIYTNSRCCNVKNLEFCWFWWTHNTWGFVFSIFEKKKFKKKKFLFFRDLGTCLRFKNFSNFYVLAHRCPRPRPRPLPPPPPPSGTNNRSREEVDVVSRMVCSRSTNSNQSFFFGCLGIGVFDGKKNVKTRASHIKWIS